MCGKFTQPADWTDLETLFADQSARQGERVCTPTALAQVLRLNANGARELTPMMWGFPDVDAPARPRHLHARCETIDTKATFARAFAQARGILFVSAFNEGEELPSGKIEQWVLSPNDGKPIAIAVIYEEWRRGAERAWTFVQVTTPANALLSCITDRMPAILPPEHWAAWLGETQSTPAALKALLRTFDEGGKWCMREQAAKQPSPQMELF